MTATKCMGFRSAAYCDDCQRLARDAQDEEDALIREDETKGTPCPMMRPLHGK